jgi:hypothetical protein
VPKASAALVAALALASLSASPPAQAAPCRSDATKRVVVQFLRAFNAGDIRSADRFFAAIGVFRWYSTTSPGTRRGQAAYRRETLRPYLESRAQARERLQLVRFRFSGVDGGSSLGHFSGSVRRSARGLTPRTFLLRGAAECASGDPLLVLWSMVGPPVRSP